ncbi:MAG: tetratricopeptide repeat protein, partial [Thermoleophilia bacterium]
PTRVEATPDPAPGPGAGTERGPSRPGAGRGPLLPGEETRYGPLVPLLELPGPRLEASAALDPFGQGGAAIRLAPVAYVPKRARALLRAGMTVEAMALLRRATDGVEAPEPVLLFMLAQAHEKLGDLDAAKAAYQRVIELDQGRDAEGGQVFGLWARSANFVLQHLRWRAENLPFTPPDLEGLR